MGFKPTLVFVKLDLLEVNVKLLSMNANPHLVFMELAPIYWMITNVHAVQDILEEIVRFWQLLIIVTLILASMELHALNMPMGPRLVSAQLATLVHSVRLTSMNVWTQHVIMVEPVLMPSVDSSVCAHRVIQDLLVRLMPMLAWVLLVTAREHAWIKLVAMNVCVLQDIPA